MTEHVFVKKLTRAGFNDAEVYGHTPYGNDEVAVYPLLPDQLIEVMRKVLPAERERHLVTAVVVRARRGVKVLRPRELIAVSGAVTWPASPRHRRLVYLWRRLTWPSLRPLSAIGRRGHIRRRRARCRMGTRWEGGAWPAASSSSALSNVLRLHQERQQHLLERAASASASRAEARAQQICLGRTKSSGSAGPANRPT